MKTLALLLAAALLLGLAPSLQAQTITVTTTADEFDTPSGATMSLREALRDAAAAAGADTIVFDPSLDGGTITLTIAEIVINDSVGVTVDASSLTNGITLSGNNAFRIFSVASGSVFTGNCLHLTAGNGVGATTSGQGGALFNLGTTTLDRCAIYSNAGSFGGGVRNQGTMALSRCTLSLKTCPNEGGAILSASGVCTLTHCTISGNTATTRSGGVRAAGGTFAGSYNLITGNSGGNDAVVTGTGNLTSGFAQIAPLANNGGPT